LRRRARHDLAIAVNDWCVTPRRAIELERPARLIAGYETRPLDPSSAACGR
jgi:hypothetical protein